MPEKNLRDHFRPIQPDAIPAEVAEQIIRRGGLFVDRALQPRSIDGFESLRSLAHDNGDETYLANQTKIYGDDEKESIIHVIDTTPAGQVIGVGEVRFNRDSEEDYFKDKPFVGWTLTENARSNEGLGSRRLLVMRLATAAEFGLVLHSDTLITESATRIWERMVRNGLAERYDQPISANKTAPRYRFNSIEDNFP